MIRARLLKRSVRDEVETILIEAKSVLRDSLGLFGIFFEKTFTEQEAKMFLPKKGGKPGEVSSWLEQKFGNESKLAETVKWYQRLFADVIGWRNAAEHPGGHSGTLIVENFRRPGDGKLVAPTWRIEGPNPRPETSLFSDLIHLEDGLLFYCEDILAACAMEKLPAEFLQLIEIPEEQRDAKAPLRLKWTLKPGTGPAAAFDA